MLISLYVVRDKVADECGPVFQAKNDGVARRSVSKFLETVAPHDRDAYALMRIADWDTEFMKLIEAVPIPEISIDIPKFDEVEERR